LLRANNGVLQIGGAGRPYQLRRSRRRRTLGLTVTACEVRIHAPSGRRAAKLNAM